MTATGSGGLDPGKNARRGFSSLRVTLSEHLSFLGSSLPVSALPTCEPDMLATLISTVARLLMLASIPAVLAAQGAVQPMSVALTGLMANVASSRPAITPDGRWIVFSSHASTIVPGDTNGFADVFVRDRLTGATEIASVNNSGVAGNADSYAGAISADGRRIIFTSYATNLVAGDTNGYADAFVRDRIAGTTVRISVNGAGQQGLADSQGVNISGDGSTAAFYSAWPFVAGDTNGVEDVFVVTLASGALEVASVSSTGVWGNGSSFSPCMSHDGRIVVFHGLASNLVPGDTNGGRDVFVRDRAMGTTERVSVGPGGVEGNNQSEQTSCSADGRFVAFYSAASNLVGNDTNGAVDVFVHDRQSSATERVSVASSGAEGTGGSLGTIPLPSISADGRYVAFATNLQGLVAGTLVTINVFVRDRVLARTVLASQDSLGASANGASAVQVSYASFLVRERVAIAANPPIVVFNSVATNLRPGDGIGADVFAIDVGLRAASLGPATVGGTIAVGLASPAYPSAFFASTFSPSSAAGLFLPGMQWLPLDLDPLLLISLALGQLDSAGTGGWSVPVPANPALSGLQLSTAALLLDFAGPSLFPAISNAIPFVVQ